MQDIPRVAHQLRVDAVTVEVSQALTTAGIAHLLLKGPVTTAWLYEPGEVRGYRDSDLLVDPRTRDQAAQVLSGLGFGNHHLEVLGLYRPDNESSWTRHGSVVDLHDRLVGIPAPCAVRAWEALHADTVPFVLRGHTLATLAPVARTMHLALHLAQSANDPGAERDLRRALKRLALPDWQAAADLADRLGAGPAFSAGLSALPEAADLCARLGLQDRPTPLVLLTMRGASPEARGIARLLERPRHERLRTLRTWFSADPGAGHDLAPRRLAAAARLLPATADYLRAAHACRTGRARTPRRST